MLVCLELLPTAHRYDPHDSVVTTSPLIANDESSEISSSFGLGHAGHVFLCS